MVRDEPMQLDAAALERLERFFELADERDHLLQRLVFECAAACPSENSSALSAEPSSQQLAVHFLVRLHVADGLLLRDLVQRRLGDVDAALLDQLAQVAEDEGQQQRADVAAVDVGVGHQHELAVAALGDVFELGSRAGRRPP